MISAKEENNIREEGMGDQGAAVVTGLSGKVLLRRRHLKKHLKATESELAETWAERTASTEP